MPASSTRREQKVTQSDQASGGGQTTDTTQGGQTGAAQGRARATEPANETSSGDNVTLRVTGPIHCTRFVCCDGEVEITRDPTEVSADLESQIRAEAKASGVTLKKGD